MRLLIGVPILALSACMAPVEPTRFSGPAIDALVTLPSAQLEATLRVADEIADGCADYAVSNPMKYALLAERGARTELTFSKASPQAISVETDVTRRTFQAKHGLVVGQDNTCAAIAAEIAEQTAYSAVIFPS